LTLRIESQTSYSCRKATACFILTTSVLFPQRKPIEGGLQMTDTNQAGRARIGIVPGAAIASGLLKEAEIWVAAQGKVLSLMEAMLTEWAGRGRAAVDVFSRSLQKASECRHPIDLVQAQQELLCDALRWAATDVHALSGGATVLTRKVAAVFEGHDDDAREARRGRPEARGSQPLDREAAE
jgi:hypothetical protein